MGSVRQLPSGKWQARWREPGSLKVLGRTFARRRDADDFIKVVEVDKLRGVYHDPSLGRITLRAYWPLFLQTSPHLRSGTVTIYTHHATKHILPRLGGKPIGSITRLDVENWIAELVRDGVGVSTINAAYRLLRRILSTAEASDRIGRNPARGVKAPPPRKSPRRYLSAEELLAIERAAPVNHGALVALLGWSGPRIGEALALTPDDVDLERGRVSITRSATETNGHVEIGPTKTGLSRSVPVLPYVINALVAHMEAFPPRGPAGLIFADGEGGPIRRTNWRRRVWLPTVAAARVPVAGESEPQPLRPPRPRPHDLRHTAAALAIRAGAHPKAIQEMLGHSSIQVTLDVYGHLFPSLAEDLVEKLNAIAEGTAEPRVAPMWHADGSG